MRFFKTIRTHGRTDQMAAEIDIRRTQMMRTLRGIVVVENRMIGIDQSVRLFQLQQITYLTCVYQTVTTHQRFVIRHRRHDLLVIKMAYLDQTTALHTVQTQLTDRHADMLIIGRHQHLHRIIAGTLKSGFR